MAGPEECKMERKPWKPSGSFILTPSDARFAKLEADLAKMGEERDQLLDKVADLKLIANAQHDTITLIGEERDRLLEKIGNEMTKQMKASEQLAELREVVKVYKTRIGKFVGAICENKKVVKAHEARLLGYEEVVRVAVEGLNKELNIHNNLFIQINGDKIQGITTTLEEIPWFWKLRYTKPAD